MINNYLSISILILFSLTNAYAGSADQKKINYCIGVFSYSMNYFMLQNNEGAAKV